jgi:hypothetical protein
MTSVSDQQCAGGWSHISPNEQILPYIKECKSSMVPPTLEQDHHSSPQQEYGKLCFVLCQNSFQ